MQGPNAHAMFMSPHNAPGNAFVIYKVAAGATLGSGTEVARIGVDGDLTLTGAVVAARRKLKEGANQTNGYGQLTAGVLTVASTIVTANTRVRVTREPPGGTLGYVYCRFADPLVGAPFPLRSPPATATGRL